MAGAAAVVGVMHALAARKAKVNALGIVGLGRIGKAMALRAKDRYGSVRELAVEIEHWQIEAV